MKLSFTNNINIHSISIGSLLLSVEGNIKTRLSHFGPEIRTLS